MDVLGKREGSKPGVTVNGKVIVLAASVKALLCRIPATRALSAREVWVPHGVVHDKSEVFDFGDHKEGMLVVSAWFHSKEGLP